MNTVLTAEAVEAVFRGCLFKDGEDTAEHVRAEGVIGNVEFHPGRLAASRDAIVTMLMELPKQFRRSAGGGWSFLNACQDRHGHQWADLHATMEQLFLLGSAIGKVRACLPREVWPMLPGGMPYYVIDDIEATAVLEDNGPRD